MGNSKIWRCTVCGYEYEGEEAPDTCPLCRAPKSEFILISTGSVVGGEAVNITHHKRTVAELMVETMVNWGITHVFGMVGHSNLGLADAIRKECDNGRLEFVGVRHEGAAAFAASAFAKLTGRPAVCMSIAGPGATNMLTGLWDANIDRVPVLAFTGQINTQVLGAGTFQEIDLAAAFDSVACWSQTVYVSSKHAELMNLAIKNAITRRGVGHLIFPNEVQVQDVSAEAVTGTPAGRLPVFDIPPQKDDIAAAVLLLVRAKRPAIIIGHGSCNAIKSVVKLAEWLRCPIITTFKAKGLIPDSHPLACGVLGLSGTMVASDFMNNADLLLVFGASFSQHTGINTDIPTIQVDYDPLIIGKLHAVAQPVLSEVAKAAQGILRELSIAGSIEAIDQRQEIAQKCDLWREEKKMRSRVEKGNGLNSTEIFLELSELLPEDAVIAVDVGNNTYSFGRYFESKKQTILMSGYLGSVGFGYPAAIGASVITERPVVALTGDGGFGQYMAELCTAVLYKLKIVHILLNNNELGKISQEQKLQNFPVWQTSLHNPNFAEYAKICGAKGTRVTKISELSPAVTEALAYDGPSMIEIMCDAELI